MRIVAILLLGSLAFMPTQSWAANCKIYEYDLEIYFMDYVPGGDIPLGQVEDSWSRCQTPSPKMEMIYHYFQAVYALRSKYLNESRAYEFATSHYDRAVRHIADVDWEDSDPFTVKFYEAAEGLEAALFTLAYRLGYQRQERYYGQIGDLAAGDWEKANRWPEANFGLSRGAGQRLNGPPEFELDGKWMEKERTTRSNARYRFGGRETGEEVGELTGLDPIEYLRWRKQEQKASQANAETYRTASPTYTYRSDKQTYRVYPEYYAPNYRSEAQPVWVAPAPETAYRTTESNYRTTANYRTRGTAAPQARLMTGWVCIADQVPVRIQPGDLAPEVDRLGLGEKVDWMEGDQTVNATGTKFYKVRTPRGKVGWVPADVIRDASATAIEESPVTASGQRLAQPLGRTRSATRDGQPAVMIRAVNGYIRSRLNPEKSFAIPFQAGEVVYLADYVDNWARVESEDGTKIAWVQELDAISVEEIDVQIAYQIRNAYQQQPGISRKRALERIPRTPGFDDAELADLVLELIRQN
ncbi:MAG: SH3 domain-containing protein [Bacteroidota bacterium]